MGRLEIPVFLANAVAEEKGSCPILLPNHRRSLYRIEDRVVDGVTVVEIVAVVETLAEIVPQRKITARILRILPQIHKFNWLFGPQTTSVELVDLGAFPAE